MTLGKAPTCVLLVLASTLAHASAQYGEVDQAGYGGEGGITLPPSGEAGGTEFFVGSQGTASTDCDCLPDVKYVCGSDGNTYDNTCMAQCAGVVPVFQGVCYNGCMCFPVIEPFCWVPEQTSFLNDCLFNCAVRGSDPLADFVLFGECTGACSECHSTDSTVCDVSPEGAGNEYVNACYAECSGVSQWQLGTCDEVAGVARDSCDIQCSSEGYSGDYDLDVPVCGTDRVTYENTCMARCIGSVPAAYTGPCEASCDACAEEGGPEVCGMDGKTYSNACGARCASTAVNKAVEGGCDNAVAGCGCSAEVLEPVCAMTSNTFMNACFAGCASEAVVHEGPCDYGEYYEPLDGYGNPITVVDGVVISV